MESGKPTPCQARAFGKVSRRARSQLTLEQAWGGVSGLCGRGDCSLDSLPVLSQSQLPPQARASCVTRRHVLARSLCAWSLRLLCHPLGTFPIGAQGSGMSLCQHLHILTPCLHSPRDDTSPGCGRPLLASAQLGAATALGYPDAPQVQLPVFCWSLPFEAALGFTRTLLHLPTTLTPGPADSQDNWASKVQ